MMAAKKIGDKAMTERYGKVSIQITLTAGCLSYQKQTGTATMAAPASTNGERAM
jgi:hypothetical protein